VLAAQPPRLERTPAYVLAEGAASKRLLAACPRVLPKMAQPSPHWEAYACRAGRPGCGGQQWDVLDLVDGGFGTRPPAWSHVVVYAGDLQRAFPFTMRTLGAVTWNSRRGTLVLAPSYPAGGEQGGHLIFRWRLGRTGYAVGLHAWRPLAAVRAVLRSMIFSLPRP
jgi:putative hemolysin